MYNVSSSQIYSIYLAVFAVLLVFYVVSAIGYSKLLKRSDYGDIAWMAWVPFFNRYAAAKFLQEETQSDEWMKWLIAFSWAVNLIPGIGTIISFIIGIIEIVLMCTYINKFNGSVIQYVLVFLFAPALPFLWCKNYSPRNIEFE